MLAAAPACNPPSPAPPDDPAEVVVGERLFLETRFAQFFAANGGSDVNQPLASGDPVLDVLETTADARTNPFAGKSMNCRVCHLVDESPDPEDDRHAHLRRLRAPQPRSPIAATAEHTRRATRRRW